MNQINKANGIGSLLRLRACLKEGHSKATNRPNASTQFLLGAYQMNNNNVIQSCISALGTMGGLHAPVQSCCHLLYAKEFAESCKRMIAAKMRVPGYGNSFIKGGPDPVWEDTDEELRTIAPDMHRKIHDGKDILINSGKSVHPNAAIYTAAYAVLASIPPTVAPILVLEFRSSAWRQLLTNTYHTTKE